MVDCFIISRKEISKIAAEGEVLIKVALMQSLIILREYAILNSILLRHRTQKTHIDFAAA